MIMKTINDLIGLDGLMLILLVFNIYPRISSINLLNPIITKYSITMEKAINKV